MTTTHRRVCHLCEAMCGIEVELDGRRIVSVRGDESDVLSAGHVCPKVQAIQGIHEDPDRLRTPQRRVGDRWHEIGWDEALDEAAERLRRVRREHGARAVALYLGNPTVHNYGAMIYVQLFKAALGRANMYSATSLDQLPHMLTAHLMFGHQLRLPVPDLDRTQHLLVFGANPLVSNGSLMSAGDVGARLSALRARGGRLVVVDPRRSETAAEADQHVAIRPGTDALLLLAMLHEVFRLGKVRPGRLGRHIKGLEKLRSLCEPFTPASVAAATGIAAQTIELLAQEFCDAERAAAYGRVGSCTQEFGGLTAWLIQALNTITGRLDEPGGVMFAKPAAELVRYTPRGSFARKRSRVRGLPEFGGEFPAATLAEEIETPGPGQVRALVTFAGNPVLSSPNGRRLEAALPSLDFRLAIDIYRNETTRHADLILPPTFGIEDDHYDLAFHLLTVRNTAKYSPAAFERGSDARHDWEILLGLSSRLGAGKLGNWLGRLPPQLRPFAPPSTLLDIMLRVGPYGLGRGGLSLSKLRKNPGGIDFGPLQPVLPAGLRTRDGKVDLVPRLMELDVARARERLSRAAKEPMVLIGRRELCTNNSWIHNTGKLNQGKRRCTLQVHPDDATGLRDGQQVRVTSRVGSIEAELEVTDQVMPGVVSLPHGWGHDRHGAQLRVAQLRPGVSVNDITDETLLDALTGNAAFSGVPVRVEGC